MVSDDDLKNIRQEIQIWASDFVRDGQTLFKGGDDGDSLLFSGLLYYSGEKWAGSSVMGSFDHAGGLWRSPYRKDSRSDGDYGMRRMSFDNALGAVLFLITEYKYVNPCNATAIANSWAKWIEGQWRNGWGFSLCNCNKTDHTNWGCALHGDFFTSFRHRGSLLRRMFEYVGARVPTGKGWFGPTQRLGDGGDFAQAPAEWRDLCQLTPDKGKKYACHINAVITLIMQELGDAGRRPCKDTGLRMNPFWHWVNEGRQSNDAIRSQAFELAKAANQSHLDGTNQHHQWAWERSSEEKKPPHLDSCGWDMIFAINLLLQERPWQ